MIDFKDHDIVRWPHFTFADIRVNKRSEPKLTRTASRRDKRRTPFFLPADKSRIRFHRVRAPSINYIKPAPTSGPPSPCRRFHPSKSAAKRPSPQPTRTLARARLSPSRLLSVRAVYADTPRTIPPFTAASRPATFFSFTSSRRFEMKSTFERATRFSLTEAQVPPVRIGLAVLVHDEALNHLSAHQVDEAFLLILFMIHRAQYFAARDDPFPAGRKRELDLAVVLPHAPALYDASIFQKDRLGRPRGRIQKDTTKPPTTLAAGTVRAIASSRYAVELSPHAPRSDAISAVLQNRSGIRAKLAQIPFRVCQTI